jgi:hypothetical protein
VCALSPTHSPSARQPFNTRERQSGSLSRKPEDQHLPGGLLSNLQDERAPRGDADAATDWSARTKPHCREHLGERDGGRERAGETDAACMHARTHALSHAHTHARTHACTQAQDADASHKAESSTACQTAVASTQRARSRSVTAPPRVRTWFCRMRGLKGSR